MSDELTTIPDQPYRLSRYSFELRFRYMLSDNMSSTLHGLAAR